MYDYIYKYDSWPIDKETGNIISDFFKKISEHAKPNYKTCKDIKEKINELNKSVAIYEIINRVCYHDSSAIVNELGFYNVDNYKNLKRCGITTWKTELIIDKLISQMQDRDDIPKIGERIFEQE